MNQADTDQIYILDAAYTDEPGIAALPETGTEVLVPLLVTLALAYLTYLIVLRYQRST